MEGIRLILKADEVGRAGEKWRRWLHWRFSGVAQRKAIAQKLPYLPDRHERWFEEVFARRIGETLMITPRTLRDLEPEEIPAELREIQRRAREVVLTEKLAADLARARQAREERSAR